MELHMIFKYRFVLKATPGSNAERRHPLDVTLVNGVLIRAYTRLVAARATWASPGDIDISLWDEAGCFVGRTTSDLLNEASTARGVELVIHSRIDVMDDASVATTKALAIFLELESGHIDAAVGGNDAAPCPEDLTVFVEWLDCHADDAHFCYANGEPL